MGSTETKFTPAHLIAAAPDLYEALACFLEDPRFQVGVGGNPHAVEEMLARGRAALAKARGAAEQALAPFDAASPPAPMTELVEIVGDEIVIRIPFDTFNIAAPIAFEREYGENVPRIADVDTFAREVYHQLRKEDERGDTLVHHMLDTACIAAVEAGSEGLEDK